VVTQRAAAITLTLCLLGPLCVRTSLSQNATYRLELSQHVGQTSRYRLAFDIHMRAEIVGQGEPDPSARELTRALAEGMALRTMVEYEQRLVGVAEDGVRTFEVRWHDYEFTGQLGDQEIPPPAGYVASMRDLLSQTALMRTTPTGRTIAVTYSHPRLAGLSQGLGQTEGGMPTYLPETPVAVGDSWTSTAEVPLGLEAEGFGSLALELVHSLKEIREGPDGTSAIIELSGSYSRLQGAEEFELGAPMHVQASLTGTSVFDITLGRFSGGHYEIDMFALHAEDGVEIQLTGHANGNLQLLNGR
jgi:hypothetical protein